MIKQKCFWYKTGAYIGTSMGIKNLHNNPYLDGIKNLINF